MLLAPAVLAREGNFIPETPAYFLRERAWAPKVGFEAATVPHEYPAFSQDT